LEFVEEDDTVLMILEKMKKYAITSLPIRDSKTRRFIGIIDVLDIVTFAITKFATVHLQAYESYQQMESFAKTKASVIHNISGRNQWVTIHERKPFAALVQMLSDPHTHRVGVINDRMEVVDLVSQSAVVRFFYACRAGLDEPFKRFLEQKVDEWTHIHHKRLYTINMNEHVYDAFRKIWDLQVSGLAVLDDNGKLVANISASDIKKCRYYPIIGQMVKDLYKPIKDFLRIPDPNASVIKKKEHVPFFVHKGDSMTAALGTLVENNVHRIFVVDDHQKPIAVISLCDVLGKFWELVHG
jgi:CBS domain-containing protein